MFDNLRQKLGKLLTRKKKPLYYRLLVKRGNLDEIAIIKLVAKPNGQELHGPVLTERDLIPDLAEIPDKPTGNNDELYYTKVDRECGGAMVSVLKHHTKQVKPEQASEIESF